MIKNVLIFVLYVICLAPFSVLAQVTVNGFASAGGGKFFGDLEEGQLTEGFYTDEFDASPFIKFAIQTRAEVNERTTITGQFISRGIDDFDVADEWAYISYKLTDATDVRLGRMRAPLFMYSDYIDVGYAYPWIRAPIELYRLPFNTVEGIDIVNTHYFGDWDGSFQFYFGHLEEDAVLNNNEISLDLTDFGGVNYVLSNDWFSFRLSYNRAKYSFSIPEPALPLFAGLEGAAAGFASVGLTDFADDITELIDILDITEESGQFYGVGFTVDKGDWLVASEYTILDVGDQSLVSNDEAWYVMLGRRFGSFTFHVTYSDQEADPEFEILDLIPSIGDPNLEALRIGAASAIINEQDTVTTVGLRYDYGASTAFKIEASDITQESDGIDGKTLSFAIDIVF